MNAPLPSRRGGAAADPGRHYPPSWRLSGAWAASLGSGEFGQQRQPAGVTGEELLQHDRGGALAVFLVARRVAEIDFHRSVRVVTKDVRDRQQQGGAGT